MSSKLQTIDAKTLKEKLDQREIILIDVREAGEYATERIEGAKLMPLSQFNPEQIKALEGQEVVLYCQSGNRSTKAGEWCLKEGLIGIRHLEGGLPNWKKAGYEVEKSKNAPISIFRQIQIVAGSLVFLGTILGVLVSPKFLFLSGFVGVGLVFAGITNTCAMGMLLAKLPYNNQ